MVRLEVQRFAIKRNGGGIVLGIFDPAEEIKNLGRRAFVSEMPVADGYGLSEAPGVRVLVGEFQWVEGRRAKIRKRGAAAAVGRRSGIASAGFKWLGLAT